MEVIVQGQGSFQRNDTPFSRDWSSSTTTHTISGTIYNITATPAAGWKFARFEWVATFERVYILEGSEANRFTSDFSGETWHNPLERTGVNWTTLDETIGKVCDFTEFTGYHGPTYRNYEVTETMTVSSITVIFERDSGPSPSYTGLLIRNGAGTGLLRGANGLPLADA